MEIYFIISYVLLWLIVLLNLLLTLLLVKYHNSPTSRRQIPLEGLKAGTFAPPFKAQRLDGSVATLADYSGQEILLAFISPGCQPCHDLVPSLEELRPSLQGAGAELVLVSWGTMEETHTLITELNTRLPVLVAPQADNPFFPDYQVQSTPSYCFIDSQGKVQSAGSPGQHNVRWTRLISSFSKQASLT